MALLDILRNRAARRGSTEEVICGQLGSVTVEALSSAECARLRENPRALLYAACRELQAAGEALRKEGALFRPEEILEHLTEDEAALAAQVILKLSGWDADFENALTPAQADAVPAETAPSSLKESPSSQALPLSADRPSPVPAVTLAQNQQESILPASIPVPLQVSFSKQSSQHSAPMMTNRSPALPSAELQGAADMLPEIAAAAAELMARELQHAAIVR